MKLLNLLAISLLLTLFPEGLAMAQNPCKEIKATAEVKNTTNQKDGSVTVTIEGNSHQFRIFLIAPKKEDNRLDLTVEEIKDLSPGDYVLVITEAKEGEFCPKHIKVAIK
ncbi:MAG TPA: hypothetical protein VK517_03880 [Cyclobacteriaceae bacterium]|nr:hypothetical protein [Cyclobacteriaceae bacterium]